jgi:predicted AAA+ superfamily ATPase
MDLSRLKNISSPYVLILVGPPLSGKTYFVKEFISKIKEEIEEKK